MKSDVKFVRIRGRIVPIHANGGVKRGRGRPKGSKNKATVAAQAVAKQVEKVPAKFKSTVYQGVAIRHGLEKGAAVGFATFGTVAAGRKYLFNRGTRLQKVAETYARRPDPALPASLVTKVVRGKKKVSATGAADMFDTAKFNKAKKFFTEGQRKAAKFGPQGERYLKGARFLRKHGLKIAIGAGVIAGGYSYFYKRAKMEEND